MLKNYLSFEKSCLESFVIHLHTDLELYMLYLSLPSPHCILSRVCSNEKYDYHLNQTNDDGKALP